MILLKFRFSVMKHFYHIKQFHKVTRLVLNYLDLTDTHFAIFTSGIFKGNIVMTKTPSFQFCPSLSP